jgi:glycosyltransferase involved in cell wall biosynthesis
VKQKPLVSLVIPVFNEEESVETACHALRGIMQQVEEEYDYEFIFTDNHSTDRTFDILTSRGISVINDPLPRASSKPEAMSPFRLTATCKTHLR